TRNQGRLRAVPERQPECLGNAAGCHLSTANRTSWLRICSTREINGRARQVESRFRTLNLYSAMRVKLSLMPASCQYANSAIKADSVNGFLPSHSLGTCRSKPVSSLDNRRAGTS